MLAAAFPEVGIGLLGVSLAFGLTVLTMAYAIGHVSGCHLNPAVTVGLAVGGRFPAAQILPYVLAQVIGAILGAFVLYLIANGVPDFDAVASGFAANGYGEHSPGGYSLGASLVAEVVLTMMFLFVIMGSTHGKAPAGFAPIAIGLCLTLIHLVSIPVSNTSVNPARSTGVALLLNSLVCTIGIGGGFLFSVYLQDVNPGAFLASLTLLTGFGELMISMVKAALFGLFAGLVGCYQGLNVKGGAKGVGDAVNETVVYSFMALFVVNVVVTAVGVKATAG